MSIVAKVYRGELVDLTHAGHIAVVDADGKLLHGLGDPLRVTFARSSAKPMQAVSTIETGAVDAYGITDRELALFCASHSGESFHVETLHGIFEKAGLDFKLLQCGVHMPFSAEASAILVAKQLSAYEAHCNCSGKHAGMLITGQYLGEVLSDYYKPSNPIQQRILKNIAEICDIDASEIQIAVDGCGVPVHAMPLNKFAQGMARLAQPLVFGEQRMQAVIRIAHAMNRYPEMVAGTDRFCTRLMQVCKDRFIAKSGAGAYYAIGVLGKGIGMAFKIEDGAKDVIYAVVLKTLRQLDLISEAELAQLSVFTELDIFNHKRERVGRTEVAFELKHY